ncbi:MAG: hypothetical protein J5833_05685 [Victivallales bacterium]|nr:hypothetical protein [Victivallales bacterium]
MKIVGIDIGTTAVKACMFDGDDGKLLGIGHAEYTLETPAPDIVELEAEEYWNAVQKALSQLPNERYGAVAITGQAETLVTLDSNGQPTGKAIVWLDNRAKQEAEEITAHFGAEELFRLSGQTEILPCFPAPKILWLKRNEPERFAKTAKFMMVEDYIGWRLSGAFATCKGLLPSSIYYDIRTGKYYQPMLDFIGISEDRLPPLASPGETFAEFNGTRIAAAPIDHVCGNLGAGCGITETTGCALAICAVADELLYDEQKRISTYCGATDKSFALLPWTPTGGMILRHFRDHVSGGLSYDELGAMAAQVKPGADGLIILPHCAGAVSPVTNPNARGVAWGFTLAHTKAHWVRAIMESIAYLLRDNIETLRSIGCPVNAITSLGGAASSPVWLQIKADVLQMPVNVPECPELTALGAAMLAKGGDCSSMLRTARTVLPGAPAYEESFAQYKRLNDLLLPTF